MVPETRPSDAPAFRLTWRTPASDDGSGTRDESVLYWFAETPSVNDVSRTLQAWVSYLDFGEGVRHQPTSSPGTPDEVSAWTDAASAYLDEVVVATADLRSAAVRRRRRSWWPARWWAMPRYRDVRTAAQARVDAATAAYRPVREVIEQRLAERTAATAEAARHAQQERARRRREAEARFEAWQRRREVADQPLAGGRTPRQMAARGDTPAQWPVAVAAAVGDVDTWWASVRAAVRNEQARAAAVRTVIEAVTATAAALENAGRPGIGVVDEAPREILHGWWVDFTWSRPGVERLKTPPDMPVDHLWGGRWDYGLYLPDRLLFFVPGLGRSRGPERTAVRPDAYRFATVTTERIHNSGYTRPAWWTRTVAEFAESLFPSQIYYRADFPGAPQLDTPMTDHADPAVLVPYIEAVTERAVAAFRNLAPGPAQWL